MSIAKLKEVNSKKQKLAFIRTYGCQMNVHDSEKILGILTEAGFKEARTQKEADVIVYNTCCVRENAENKVYGHLGLLKKHKVTKPNLKIILCGCMMQNESAVSVVMEKHKHVDIIFGTYNMHKLADLLWLSYETGKQVIDIMQTSDYAGEELTAIRKQKHKASVNIMYGCNNFCSYCIVPYVRGRERSRKPEDILKEIEYLVNDGVKEITLLGQNVNSYGKGLEESINFPQLLARINHIEGDFRIRFITSHPKDLSDELVYAIRDLKKVCKHLHLPIQSGSTEILKKMNRGYTKEDYLNLIYKLKQNVPDISVTTDIIVGFPTETEKDFLETCDCVEKVRFSGAFTFIYSIRTGTPAAEMTGQVPEPVVTNRFNRLLETLNPIILEENKKKIGQTLVVLADELSDPKKGSISGRSDDNSIVHFKADESVIGSFVKVKITDCKTFYLVGEIIE